MIKRALAVGGVVAAVVTLAGCGSNNFRDVEGAPSRNPDTVVVFNNVDGHPNIAKLCIDGVAFATTTRDFNALTRVPEWDAGCPKR